MKYTIMDSFFLFKVMDNWHRTLSYNENDFSLSKWLECWYSVQCFVLLVLLHFTRMTGIVVSHSIEFTIFDKKQTIQEVIGHEQPSHSFFLIPSDSCFWDMPSVQGWLLYPICSHEPNQGFWSQLHLC